MITRTFLHIPTVGAKTEDALWQAGVTGWDELIDGAGDEVLKAKAGLAREHVAKSREKLAQGDAAWFARKLPSAERWRVFSAFRESTAFFDIETCGVGREDHPTTIAVYDGREVRTYVHGENLDDFVADIARYSVLVTFNGACFDLPVLQRWFGVQFRQAHIDLRPVLRQVGLTGGLKKIEKHLGISREEVDGLDGWFAVLLWNEFVNSDDPAALETLLAYNVADAVNLEPLLVHAVNTLLERTPFYNEESLPPAEFGALSSSAAPFRPSMELVERLKARMAGY